MNEKILDIKIRHLYYFVVLADTLTSSEEKNFESAAYHLNTEQPALSRKIKDLEKKIELQLLDRSTKPTKLTSAGQSFLLEIRELINKFEQAIELAHSVDQGVVGYLSIGFTTSVANSVLPDILKAFRLAYPEVKLNCRQMASDRQIQSLIDGQIDIGLFHPNHEASSYKDLEFITILEEPLLVVFPEDHPLERESEITLQMLAQEDFVLPIPQDFSGLSEQINLLCHQAGFVPRIVQEATFMVTILGFVAGGMGIALLPANAMSLRRKGVIYREIGGLNATICTNMVWRKHNSSAILQNFNQITQKVTQKYYSDRK